MANVTLLASASRTADGVGTALDCNTSGDITLTLTAQSPASGFLRNLIFGVEVETSADNVAWSPLRAFELRPIYAEPFPTSGLPNPRASRTEQMVILEEERQRYLRAKWTCHDATTGVAEASLTFGIAGVTET